MKAEYYQLQDEDKEAQGFHRLTFEQVDGYRLEVFFIGC